MMMIVIVIIMIIMIVITIIIILIIVIIIIMMMIVLITITIILKTYKPIIYLFAFGSHTTNSVTLSANSGLWYKIPENVRKYKKC